MGALTALWAHDPRDGVGDISSEEVSPEALGLRGRSTVKEPQGPSGPWTLSPEAAGLLTWCSGRVFTNLSSGQKQVHPFLHHLLFLISIWERFLPINPQVVAPRSSWSLSSELSGGGAGEAEITRGASQRALRVGVQPPDGSHQEEGVGQTL